MIPHLHSLTEKKCPIGFFIAPVRGTYHFELYIAGYGHDSHRSAAVLVKNGENVCTAYYHWPSHFGSSAHGITLLLEARDVVFLRLYVNSWIYDDGNNYSTFSGHLLLTMWKAIWLHCTRVAVLADDDHVIMIIASLSFESKHEHITALLTHFHFCFKTKYLSLNRKSNEITIPV